MGGYLFFNAIKLGVFIYCLGKKKFNKFTEINFDHDEVHTNRSR